MRSRHREISIPEVFREGARRAGGFSTDITTHTSVESVTSYYLCMKKYESLVFVYVGTKGILPGEGEQKVLCLAKNRQRCDSLYPMWQSSSPQRRGQGVALTVSRIQIECMPRKAPQGRARRRSASSLRNVDPK